MEKFKILTDLRYTTKVVLGSIVRSTTRKFSSLLKSDKAPQ